METKDFQAVICPSLVFVHPRDQCDVMHLKNVPPFTAKAADDNLITSLSQSHTLTLNS